MNFKKTLQTIVLAPALLFPTYAKVSADGFDYAPKEGQAASKANTDLIDGYVKGSADASPSEQGITALGRFMIKPGTWRVGASALADFRKYKGEEDTTANSQRLTIEGGKYLLADKELEIYAAARLGGELAQVGGADFDLDVYDGMVGGIAGIASQKDGWKAAVSADYSMGKFDAKVEPNADIDGNYKRFQVGGEGSVRLWSDGQSQPTAQFDVEPTGNKEKSIVATARASFANEDYSGVQKTNTIKAGADVKYIFDGKDIRAKIGPAVNFETSKTTGDFEAIKSNKFGATLQLEFIIKDTLYLGAEGGWEHYEHGDFKKDGAKGGVYIGAKF